VIVTSPGHDPHGNRRGGRGESRNFCLRAPSRGRCRQSARAGEAPRSRSPHQRLPGAGGGGGDDDRPPRQTAGDRLPWEDAARIPRTCVPICGHRGPGARKCGRITLTFNRLRGRVHVGLSPGVGLSPRRVSWRTCSVCFFVRLFFTPSRRCSPAVFGGHDAGGAMPTRRLEGRCGGLEVAHAGGPDIDMGHDFDHSVAEGPATGTWRSASRSFPGPLAVVAHHRSAPS